MKKNIMRAASLLALSLSSFAGVISLDLSGFNITGSTTVGTNIFTGRAIGSSGVTYNLDYGLGSTNVGFNSSFGDTDGNLRLSAFSGTISLRFTFSSPVSFIVGPPLVGSVPAGTSINASDFLTALTNPLMPIGSYTVTNPNSDIQIFSNGGGSVFFAYTNALTDSSANYSLTSTVTANVFDISFRPVQSASDNSAAIRLQVDVPGFTPTTTVTTTTDVGDGDVDTTIEPDGPVTTTTTITPTTTTVGPGDIPEPGTWAMMIAGALGALALRRRSVR
jgi:hypothetical protein